MQGITGTVQFAQFPGMTGRIYLDTQDLQRLMDVRPTVSGQSGITGCVTREYWGATGGTGNRYVNVNYTVNANTSGKVVTEITF